MGIILDRIFGVSLFAYPILSEPWGLNFYIIKIEVQLTPASLLGMAVIGYLVMKKG
ncbi:MAG: hypothetical protein N3A69_09145 [Leptospiraceae bacterium]|nr:hypothetical protein [Leptospiraceae bacterium]